jgi:hypothetical protein
MPGLFRPSSELDNAPVGQDHRGSQAGPGKLIARPCSHSRRGDAVHVTGAILFRSEEPVGALTELRLAGLPRRDPPEGAQ